MAKTRRDVAGGKPVRAAPPLASLILRITFIAPLWGVLFACGLISLVSILGMIVNGDMQGLVGVLGRSVHLLVPALIVGYPIGAVTAFLTALLLVAVVRRYGGSRKIALLTPFVPGTVLGFVLGALIGFGGLRSLLFGIAEIVVCFLAALLTWMSSLRGLVHPPTGDVAAIFA